MLFHYLFLDCRQIAKIRIGGLIRNNPPRFSMIAPILEGKSTSRNLPIFKFHINILFKEQGHLRKNSLTCHFFIASLQSGKKDTFDTASSRLYKKIIRYKIQISC